MLFREGKKIYFWVDIIFIKCLWPKTMDGRILYCLIKLSYSLEVKSFHGLYTYRCALLFSVIGASPCILRYFQLCIGPQFHHQIWYLSALIIWVFKKYVLIWNPKVVYSFQSDNLWTNGDSSKQPFRGANAWAAVETSDKQYIDWSK